MKKDLHLTKWWQKTVCVLGIPILINTVAATQFQTLPALGIALLLTTLFLADIIRRKRERVIWELDDWWERAIYYTTWASFLTAVVLIIATFL